jgi:hypothetical protein
MTWQGCESGRRIAVAQMARAPGGVRRSYVCEDLISVYMSTLPGLIVLALRGTGSAEAAALLPCAGFVAGLRRGWRWGSGKLLQSPEDLGRSLFVQADTDQLAGIVIQRPVAPVLPDRHTVSPHRKRAEPYSSALWAAIRRPALQARRCQFSAHRATRAPLPS